MSTIQSYVTSVLLLMLTASLRAANVSMRYTSEHLSTVNGLSGNTIKFIAQDEDGFLWVGGNSGLGRYDGYQFVNYPTNRMKGYRGAPLHVGNIHLDRYNHLLWVTTSTFVNACYDLRLGRFVDYTGCGDMERAYHKISFHNSHILMGSKNYGLRLVMVRDGRFSHRDYTVAGHTLRSDVVSGIALDHQGNFWAATDKGLARIDTLGRLRLLYPRTSFVGCYAGRGVVLALSKQEQAAYLFRPNGELLVRSKLSLPVGHFAVVRGCISWQGRWLVFTDHETYTIDQHTGRFTKDEEYQIPGGSKQSQCGDMQFVGNRSGNLWIFPRHGRMRCVKLVEAMPFSSDKRGLFKVVRGDDGLYYIATYGAGLFVYDYKSGRQERFTAEDPEPLIQSDFLYTICKDRSGCIWIGQEDMGLVRLAKSNSFLSTYLIDIRHQSDKTNSVTTLFQTRDGNLQLFTEQKKAFAFNTRQKTFSTGTTVPLIVYDRLVDSQGHLWEATRGTGIFVDGDNTWLQFPQKLQEPRQFMTLRRDGLGRVWLGSWGNGLYCVLPGSRRAIPVWAKQLANERISGLVIRGDKLFVATLTGLYVGDITPRRLNAGSLVNYSPLNGQFPADEIVCLLPGQGNSLWVGTEGGGLLRCDYSRGIRQMTWKQLTTQEGMTSNNIRSLAADRHGFIWVGTENGLCRVNPRTMEVNQFYDDSNLRGNIYTDRCASLLRNGDIAFGTGNGLVLVNPNRLHSLARQEPSCVTVTNIDVNGTGLFEGLDSVVLDKALQHTHHIYLPHTVNALTIHFSNFDFRNIRSQVYQYYLENVDKGWNVGSSEAKAVYTNLSPGRYVFHVRALNLQRQGPETTLTITIRQPWYNTWWAWTLYLVALGLFLVYLYRNAKERMRLRARMREEKQLTAFRTTLFTNIAHEFRTPLAIITNAVEKIADSATPSRKDIQVTQRGARRLLRLVNQLLNFRKLESNNMKLHVEEGDIVPFLEHIFSDLWGIAQQKEITYLFVPSKKHITLTFDYDMVETIVYNLLSNAVKYTPKGGHITLKVSDSPESLSVSVADDGPGLSSEQQTQLFRPFLHGEVSRGGMGIGLYTAYQSARLHHGNLAWQTAQPHGSVFTLTLPMDDSCYAPEEYATPSERVKPDEEQSQQAEQLIREMAPQALNNVTVAIVEDDPDMMEQINREIQPVFHTCCFSDGKSALAGIAESDPALIVSDIMLPDMTGYDIVRQLRKESATAATPVILLTALDDEAHQIKGYQAGADDYMVKPCNFRVLIARIISLIKWRNEQKAMEQRKGQTEEPNASSDSASSQTQIFENRADLLFRQQVEAIVSKHIDDPSLSVDMLAEQMHIGRTRFYGKVRELFGMSPNKYITNRRLEKAADLLVEGRYNVSEVAWQVGFTSAAYFYKCFKQKYGVVPSKYKG